MLFVRIILGVLPNPVTKYNDYTLTMSPVVKVHLTIDGHSTYRLEPQRFDTTPGLGGDTFDSLLDFINQSEQ